jgi:hypothetical protein
MHSGSTSFLDLRVEQDSADPGFHFGGGAAVRFAQRFELGPEARFYIIRAGQGADPAWAYWIGVRLGVGF